MDFSGPQKAEFNNVRSLNRAFLNSLRAPSEAMGLRQAFSPKLCPMVEGLTDLQARRLSEAPFLLLSLREQDDDYWSALFADDPNGDLFVATSSDGRDRHLAAAALGFLWQLAQHNPYAVRLVSGAPIQWCDRLINCTLLRLLKRTADRTDLLRPRLSDNSEFWRKLLGPGLSSEPGIRTAAHLSALQSMLTIDRAAQYRDVRAAACKIRPPVFRVAEKPDRR
jgi:hypothetical protein